MIQIDVSFDESVLPALIQAQLKSAVDLATDANEVSKFWQFVLAEGINRASVLQYLEKNAKIYGVEAAPIVPSEPTE